MAINCQSESSVLSRYSGLVPSRYLDAINVSQSHLVYFLIFWIGYLALSRVFSCIKDSLRRSASTPSEPRGAAQSAITVSAEPTVTVQSPSAPVCGCSQTSLRSDESMRTGGSDIPAGLDDVDLAAVMKVLRAVENTVVQIDVRTRNTIRLTNQIHKQVDQIYRWTEV